jgi:predicted permease
MIDRSGVTPVLAHIADICRRLLRRPRLMVLAMFLLGPCVGAGLAVFSAVDGMLFKPLPYDRPNELFLVQQRNVRTGRAAATISAAEYAAIADSHMVSQSTALWSVGDVSIGQGDGEPHEIPYALVDERFCEVLGIRLSGGRCVRAEDVIGDGAVAVISQRARRLLFGDAPEVVGRTFRHGARRLEVIGVLPPQFVFPSFIGAQPEVVAPFAARARAITPRSRTMCIVRAPQAGDEPGLSTQLVRAATDHGVSYPPHTDLRARSLQRALFEQHETVMWLFVAGALLLLFAASINFLVLLLDAVDERRVETAARLALGIPVSALLIGAVCEVLVLAGSASSMAVAVLWLAEDWLLALLPNATFEAMASPIGARTVVAAWLCAAVIVVVTCVGLIPELLRIDPTTLLSRGRVSANTRWRQTLGLGAQVAVGVAVAAQGVSMIQLLWSRTGHAVGLPPTSAVVVVEALSMSPEHRSPYGRSQLLLGSLGVLRDSPRVVAAGASPAMPFSGSAPERELEADSTLPGAVVWRAGPQFFAALQLKVEGREFTDGDASSRTVVIVNRAFADRAWPGASALGKVLQLGPAGATLEVIGVCANFVQAIGDRVAPAVYLPLDPNAVGAVRLVARVHGSAEDAMSALAADLRRSNGSAVFRLSPLGDYIGDHFADERFQARTFATMAGLILLLCIISVLVTTWRIVTVRRRELGIRISLGGLPSEVQWLVLRSQLFGVTLGILCGAGIALVLPRLLASTVSAVPSIDWTSLSAAAIGFAIATVASAALAARRVASIPVAELFRAT